MVESFRKKMVSGARWSGAGKVLSMAANFAITLMLSRALDPVEYGMYVVALATIVILASVGTLGMDQVVVRFASVHVKNKADAAPRYVISKCFLIVLVATSAVCVAFFCCGEFFFSRVLNTPALAGYCGLLAAWLFFASLQRQLAETFRGLNDIRAATLFGGVRNSGIINSVVSCLLMAALAVGGGLNLCSALYSMLASSCLVVTSAGLTLAYSTYCRQKSDFVDLGIQRADPQSLSAQRALSEGWPLWLAMLVAVANSMGGTWLAGVVDTPSHIALFGVAQRFVMLLVAPVVIVNAVLPPLISQLYSEGDIYRLGRLVRSTSGLLLIPTSAVLVILVVAGVPLLKVLFGPYYVNAYPILVVLCVGQVTNIATGSWNVVLSMTGARYQMLGTSLLAAAAQLTIGWILGNYIGVYGVALGVCLSIVIGNLAGMLVVRKRLKIWTHSTLSWTLVRQAALLIVSRANRSTRLEPIRE